MALNQEIKGILLVAASAFSYGFLYYFGINIIREDYSPFVTMFWRFLIAAIFLFWLLFPQLKKLLEQFSLKQIAVPLILSAPLHGIAASLYFVAAKLIGGGVAEVLLFTHPITVMVFNRFVYKTEIDKSCYFAIFGLIFGTIFLADFNNSHFDLRGILIGLLSGVLFGLYIVSSKKNQVNPMFSAFLICCGSFVVCLIFAIATHSFAFPTKLNVWFNILALALICTALPIFLFQKGLRFLASEKAAIISMIEPLTVMVVSFILLNEKVTFYQIFGSSIILIAASVVALKKTKLTQDTVRKF